MQHPVSTLSDPNQIHQQCCMVNRCMLALAKTLMMDYQAVTPTFLEMSIAFDYLCQVLFFSKNYFKLYSWSRLGGERKSRLVILHADDAAEQEKKVDVGQTVEVVVEFRVHRTGQVSATTKSLIGCNLPEVNKVVDVLFWHKEAQRYLVYVAY